MLAVSLILPHASPPYTIALALIGAVYYFYLKYDKKVVLAFVVGAGLGTLTYFMLPTSEGQYPNCGFNFELLPWYWYVFVVLMPVAAVSYTHLTLPTIYSV